MQEYELKYGCNPNQKPARIYMANDGELPIQVLSGRAGYINFLDALESTHRAQEEKREREKNKKKKEGEMTAIKKRVVKEEEVK